MLQDLRFGLRMLVKSPGFTAIAVLSVALGIGANTAIFSLINAALLRPIPVRDSDRLAAVFMTDQRNPGNLPLSHLNYKDIRDQNQVFSEVAAFSFAQANWSNGNAAEQVPLQVVSGNYFAVLGTQLAQGRGFLPDEDIKATPVIVVSDGFWQRSLGGDPAIVGKTITLNRNAFTVVGVAQKGFTGTVLGADPAGWVPMAMHAVAQPNFDFYDQRRGLFLFAFGRMKPGVSIEQAGAQLRTLFAGLEQAYPNDNKGRSADAVPLLQARLNPQGQAGNPLVRLSLILMAVVGIVLLIACANVANLLIARATRRRKEIALRLALGASRMRLVRQLITESTLLSLAGGVLGLLLAYWLLDALVASDLQLPLPVARSVGIDLRVLFFTTILAIGTGLVFGIVPAIQSSKPDVVPILKNEIVASGTSHRGLRGFFSLRQTLVVAQIALSLVALVAAGAFLRSLYRASATATGFETRGVLVMNFNLGREGYTPERGQIFYDEAATRVSALRRRQTRGHRADHAAGRRPAAERLSRGAGHDHSRSRARAGELRECRLLRNNRHPAGTWPRLHARRRQGAPLVVVINETMAERFWPNADAIGKRFKFFGDKDYSTVVGIARNSKYNGVAEAPIPVHLSTAAPELHAAGRVPGTRRTRTPRGSRATCGARFSRSIRR